MLKRSWLKSTLLSMNCFSLSVDASKLLRVGSGGMEPLKALDRSTGDILGRLITGVVLDGERGLPFRFGDEGGEILGGVNGRDGSALKGTYGGRVGRVAGELCLGLFGGETVCLTTCCVAINDGIRGVGSTTLLSLITVGDLLDAVDIGTTPLE